MLNKAAYYSGMILSMLLNLWMILLDGAEAKDKGFKRYTIQVIICQVMIQSNVPCFVPATGFHFIGVHCTGGRGEMQLL